MENERSNMNIEGILKTYNGYNPIRQYAIRPALRFADAHSHPIRGGIAAAVSSGLAHYVLFEIMGQASDYFIGTNFRDPNTKMFFTKIPLPVHFVVAINILSNLRMGISKYNKKKGDLTKNGN